MSTMFEEVVKFIRDLYQTDNPIPLHEPRFIGNEKKYLNDCIESTFVSSSGAYIDRFEQLVSSYTGCEYAIPVVNGTAALHIGLLLAGVRRNDLVITQPLTFVATCNAIRYLGADPLFVDVNTKTMGMCSKSLEAFIQSSCAVDDQGACVLKSTGQRISACVPMHTFGHPCEINEIASVCNNYGIALVEDAAESLGSYFDGRHAGTFGTAGVLSFNGNKTITCGGGGMVLLQKEELAIKAKHITTTAKQPHPWEYNHDEIGYNYRLPNINAALACAQMEQVPFFVKRKKVLAKTYADFFKDSEVEFIKEPPDCSSNYWLNALLFKDEKSRDEFLTYTNKQGIMTRPVWKLMSDLPMFSQCIKTDLSVATSLQQRIANIPSSVILP